MAGSLVLLQKRRSQIMHIAAKYGVRNIRLFGSVARGEETPQSDCDMLVALEEGRDLTDFISFQQETEELIGRKVDLVSERGIHPLLASSILREAIPL